LKAQPRRVSAIKRRCQLRIARSATLKSLEEQAVFAGAPWRVTPSLPTHPPPLVFAEAKALAQYGWQVVRGVESGKPPGEAGLNIRAPLEGRRHKGGPLNMTGHWPGSEGRRLMLEDLQHAIAEGRGFSDSNGH